MNIIEMTKSPIDLAAKGDADCTQLGLNTGPYYSQYLTNVDELILNSLGCADDENGDRNDRYWGTLNL
jgi:hypothetical protein